MLNGVSDGPQPEAAHPTEIAFISDDVADWPQLAAGFGPNVRVVVLDASRDGVEQMAAALAGLHDLNAIHIVSHGRDGSVSIGAATLDTASMQGTYRAALVAIGGSLAADGDILIYGCDFTADEAGREAARTLAALTGADVAASSDRTGAANKGGDWDLETSVGTVETATALSAANVSGYADLLAPNRAPAGADQIINIAEDTGYAFTNQRFGFSDPDGNALAGIILATLPNPGEGKLTLNGASVSAGQFVAAGDFGSLVFTPAKDFNGSRVGTFTFRVVDNGGTAGGGINSDQSPNSFSFIITPVNDAPVFTMPSSTQTTLEDTALVFSSVNGNPIRLTDVDDDGVTTYQLSFSVPVATGILQLGSTAGLVSVSGNGTNVIVATGTLTSINAALEGLRYVPTADYNGSAGALNISFTATEQIGFLNGGFESPFVADGAIIQVAQQQVPGFDTTDAAGLIEIWGRGFLGVSAFEGRQFAELNATSVGTLSQTFVPTSAGTPLTFTFAHRGRTGVDVARVVAIDLGADNTFGTADDRVLATLDVTDGNMAWRQYTVNLGTTTGNAIRIAFSAISTANNNNSTGNFLDGVNVYDAAQTAQRTLSVAVTPVVDIVDDQIVTPLNTARTFNIITGANESSGADNFENAGARVTAINGAAFTAGGSITITGGRISVQTNGSVTFTPNNNFTGTTSFTYTVTSGGVTETATATITVPVPVNNPPAGQDNIVTLAEDASYTFTQASFGFSDPVEGNAFQSVLITTLPPAADGVLRLNGVAVIQGQVIAVADFARLVFTPVADRNGPGIGRFTFQVRDNGGTVGGGQNTDQTPNVFAFNITPINDPPQGTDKTVTINEDSIYGFTAADFGFSDPVEGNAFQALIVTSLPAAADGVLSLRGIAVTAGQVIAADDLSLLAFTPATNRNGAGIGSFTFQVRDDGGTTNGGVNTDPSPNVFAFNITGINDNPIDGDETAVTPEDTPISGNVLTNASDPDGNALTVSAFTIDINNDGAAESFTPGQSAVIAGVGTLTINANGSYSFTPVANYNGPVSVITYTVSDGAGGTDTSTLTLTVTPVNDPPVDGDETNSTPEDTPLVVADGAPGDLLNNASDVDGNPLTITQFVINGTAYAAGQIATITGVGTLTINANGSYSFTPVANYNGPVPVATYTVSDGAGGADTSTLTLTVTPVNDPPVDGDETNSTLEDTALVVADGAPGDLLNNASDVDGGPLSITQFVINGTTYAAGQAATIAGVGTLTINANGSYSLTPTANFNGAVPVATYTVSDGAGGTDTSTLTLTVTPVNDPPVDADEANSTLEDTPLVVGDGAPGDLLNNASDVDGSPLTITQFVINGTTYAAGQAAAIAGVGTLTINANGSYNFTPALNYNGPVPVATYTVSDGAGGIDTSTLTLSVTPVNDPPVDGDETNSTPEDTPLVVADGAPGDLLNNAGDVDGGPLSITQFVINGTTYAAGQSATIAGVGTLTINANGSYSFTPATNYNGPVPVATYTVSDGAGGADTSTLTLNVTPVNDLPVDGDETNSTLEDTTLVVGDGAPGDLLNNASDVDGNALSITQFVINGTTYAPGQTAAIAGVGTLTINANGSYSFTPVANYNGPVPVVTYTVSDGAGDTDTSTLKLTITPVNDAPVDGDETNGTPRDVPLIVPDGAAGDLLNNASDVDGAPLTITQFVVAGQTLAAGQTATIAGVGQLTINADGSYTFAPATRYVGPVPIVTYTVSDGRGGTDTSTLSLIVTPVNDPPVDGDETNSTLEDTPLVVADGAASDLLNNATDLNGDALTITQFIVGGQTYGAGQTATLAGIGTLTINANGSYTFTPVANYNGPVPVATYTVSDGVGGTDTSTLTLSVTPVNDLPIDGDETNTTVEDTPLVVTDGGPGDLLNNASDADGDPLSIAQFVVNGTTYAAGQAATIAGAGTLTINANGSYSFTPAPDFNGPVPVVTYTVTDGQGGTDTSTLSLTVAPVNDPPVDGDETNSTPEDTPLVIADGAPGDLLNNASDADGDPLTIIQFVVNGTTYAAGQTATIAGVATLTINANGSYNFTPVANYNGPVPTVTYTVSDGRGGVDTSTLTLTVTPLNDPPIDADETNTTAEDTSLVVADGAAGDLLNNASDVDGDPLSITQFVVNGTTYVAGQTATIAGVGALTINANGSYSFTPAANYNGPVPIATYTVSDGAGGTDVSTLTLTVTPVNDPPVDGDEAVAVPEDTSAAGNVLTNGSDADGDPLTVTQFIVAGQTYTAGQSATVAGVGTLTINADGSYSFTPVTHYNGPVPVATYTVSDGRGGTDTSTLTLTVTPVNDPPAGTDKIVTIAEDAAYAFAPVDFGFSDPVEGNAFSALVVTTLPAPGDGVLLLNGVAVTPGQVIPVASLGQLTFQPAANRNGNAIGSFTFQVRDDGGTTNGGQDTDPTQNTFAFNITPINDAPVDGDETNTTPEDTPLVVVDGAAGDLLANASDVDGDPLIITQFVVGGTTYTAGQTATIAGVGALTINANGSYSFTPVANYNGPVPVATYTISDGQGGADTSTLTLTVTPVADAPVVTGLGDGPIAGTDAAVYESDLASGSAPGGTRETVSGTFNAVAADGVASLTINGTTITLAQLAASSATAIVVPGAFGQLTISGYDAATGAVTYSFTLAARIDNSVDPVIESFAVTVTDANGAQASGTLGVQIVDDAPIARPDQDEVINRGGNPSSIATGNVVTGVDRTGGDPNSSDGVADAIGADAVANPVTGVAAGANAPVAANLGAPLTGAFGALTLNSDGSYSYTPDFTNPTVVGLAAQQTITDTFTYLVTDADGDSASTTLTITIYGTPAVIGLNDGPIAGTDGSVFESDLSDGSNPPGPGETLNGTFGVLGSTFAPLASIEVSGQSISIAALTASNTTPIVIPTARGTITINGFDPATGRVSYSYTLGDNVDHSPGAQIDPIAVAVIDTFGDRGASTLDIAIVDDAPTAAADINAIAEDATAPVTGSVLGNDVVGADQTATPVTGVAVGATGVPASGSLGLPLAGSYGALTLNPDGSYSYTVDNGSAAVQALGLGEALTDVYTYRVTDGDGSTTTATITITINGVNDAPVDGDEAVTTAEGVPVAGNVLTNASDVEGDPLAVTGFTVDIDGDGTAEVFLPGQTATITGVGTLVINADGSYSFSPLDDYNGPVPVVGYTVGDGQGGVDRSTLTITVTPVNDPPVDGDESFTTAEDTPASGNLLTNGSDIDGDPLSITDFTIDVDRDGTPEVFTPGQTATIANVGTLVINADGSFVFTPTGNYSGAVPPAVYAVSDGQGGTDMSTLTISVTPANDAPTDGDEAVVTAEDQPATGSVLTTAYDLDGDPLSVTQFVVNGLTYTAGQNAVLPGVGTLTIGPDGSYTFSPVADFNGPVPVVSYTVSDGNGGTDSSTLTITVAPVNDPPTDGNEVVTTPEDTPVSGNLLTNSSDPDGDPLAVAGYTLDVNGDGILESFSPGQTATIAGVGTLVINADGSYAFNAVPGYNGPVPVATYTVTDGQGGTVQSTLSITVAPVNDAPTAAPVSNVTPEDTPVTGNVISAASDPDGDPLVLTGFTVDIDGNGAGEVFAPGQPAVIAGVGTLTINADGSYSFTPAPDYNGPVPVATYAISDGNGGTASSTLTIVVSPVNDLPIDGDEVAIGAEDTPVSGNLLTNASDIDGDPLTVSGFQLDINGDGVVETFAAGQTAAIGGIGTLIVNADGSYTFTPAANFNGPVPVVTYTVSDGAGGADTSTLTISITPVNDPPLDGDEIVVLVEDTPATGNVLANASDADGDPLTVTQFVVNGTTYTAGQSATIPGVGTLTINPDGSYNFAPAANYNGLVPVATYTVSDGRGGTDTSTLSLSVTSVNDPPVDGDEVVTVSEDTAATGNVLANARDADGNPLSVTQFVVNGTTYAAGQTATIAGVGTLTINANGSYTFAPVANFNGPVPVATYSVSDGQGGIDTSTLSLTVTPVNDAPVDGDEVVTVTEDTPATGNVLSNASDADGNALIVTQFVVAGQTYVAGQSATIAGVGTLTINPNGSYSFTPVANYNGPVPVATYTVSDGQGGTDTSTLTLTVAPVNDAPADADEAVITPQDTPVAGNLLANASDVDGGPLSITQFVIGGQTYAAGQTAVIAGVGALTIGADGGYSFVPEANFTGGVPAVRYTVSDGRGGTDTSTLSIAIPGLTADVQQLLAIGRDPGLDYGDQGDRRLSNIPFDGGVPRPLIIAVNGLRSLNGTVDLSNGRPVLTAVNGVRWLQGGGEVDGRHPILEEVARLDRLRDLRDAGDRLFDHRWSDFFVRSFSGFSAAGDDDAGIMVESVLRDNAIYLEVRDTTAGGGSRIEKVTICASDGSDTSAWLHADPRGFAIIERHAGQDELRLVIEVERADGSRSSTTVVIQGSTGEIELDRAADRKRGEAATTSSALPLDSTIVTARAAANAEAANLARAFQGM